MFSSNASSSAAGDANYIEDVFSTWLYTGNGSTQTITNGIDLAGKGGLVWIKARTAATFSSHFLFDTLRGTNQYLQTDNTNRDENASGSLTAFNSNGFTAGSIRLNESAQNYASWTFRKQPKFFDIVTYTGNGTSGTTIAHNLGAVPGCMIVKKTNNTGQWCVYHRGLTTPATDVIFLNLTNAQTTDTNVWNSTAPTSTLFTLGNSTGVNNNGDTYVAYLFAHNAGGFGLTGTDNVISCGSFTTDGSGLASVTLGYEPQWLMFKRSDGTSNWTMKDVMRGSLTATVSGQSAANLRANTSDAESTNANTNGFSATATGFYSNGNETTGSATYIYIAIRRGPMKVPTTGTSVYEGTTRTGTGAAASISGLSFPPDAVLTRSRTSVGSSRYAFYDKLRGPTIYLDTAATDSEFTVAQSLTSFNQTGESFGTGAISNFSGVSFINWQFRRAPGFFDVVCYTGTGSAMTVPHNLAAVPELMIIKKRSSATNSNWVTNYYVSASQTADGYLNLTGALPTVAWSSSNLGSAPTATNFSVGSFSVVNESGGTFVAYLFATCPGVSKVGSYTGNGSSQTINCGFTGGARFVMIKRTDDNGDWYVWDTARGIVSGNDPHLSLNTTAAEVTTDDTIDTDSTGFVVNQVSATNVNVSSATYIFLAIA